MRARRGGQIAVFQISRSEDIATVYNLKVEETHHYAVGSPGILVHNKGSGEPVYAEFRADRPFMFFIYDTATGAVLFMGRVVSLP